MKTTALILTLFFINILLSAQDNTYIYGTTPYGGQNATGCIFRTNSDGSNLQVEYSLQGSNTGQNSKGFKMIDGGNGKYYGLLEEGGINNEGVLFSYTLATNTYTDIAHFNNHKTGSNPIGYLLHASNGKLYGACQKGGEHNFGTIFEFDLSNNSLSMLIEFDSISGNYPNGSLMQATNGKLYGVTKSAWPNGEGTIYEYDIINNNFSFIDITSFGIGKWPKGRLVQASNGLLYGSTTIQSGNLFAYDIINDTIWSIHNFVNIGYCNSLTLANNGNIYGTRVRGNLFGYIFEINTVTNTFTKKAQFNNQTGYNPSGELFEISDSIFYCLNNIGAYNNYGSLIKYDLLLDSITETISFNNTTSGCNPIGSLLKIGNNVYGYSNKASENKPLGGAIFEIDLSTKIATKKIILNNAPDGLNILNGLQLDNTGKLWGLSKEGSNDSKGAFFSYSPSTNSFNIEYSLPYPKLENVVSPTLDNGNLYTFDIQRALYKYNSNTGNYTYATNYDATNGQITGPMINGSSNSLYFMANGGSNSNKIMEYSTVDNSISDIHEFNQVYDGIWPSGMLLYSTNEFLYGMTTHGGSNSKGVLFKLNLQNSVYTKLFDFNDTLGKHPNGGLVEGSNGNLYGATQYGGIYNMGVLFKYDLANNTFVKLYDFDGTNGRTPSGKLLFASNGKVYGMTINGGAYDMGVIYEYDPSTNTISKKSDFDYSTGRPSEVSYLTEKESGSGIEKSKLHLVFDAFPNPTNGHINIKLISKLKDLNVKVYDSYGKLVISNNYNNINEIKLDLNLSTGIYLLKLNSSNGLEGSRKIIISN